MRIEIIQPRQRTDPCFEGVQPGTYRISATWFADDICHNFKKDYGEETHHEVAMAEALRAISGLVIHTGYGAFPKKP